MSPGFSNTVDKTIVVRVLSYIMNYRKYKYVRFPPTNHPVLSVKLSLS